jgi:hypothetical protein
MLALSLHHSHTCSLARAVDARTVACQYRQRLQHACALDTVATRQHRQQGQHVSTVNTISTRNSVILLGLSTFPTLATW